MELLNINLKWLRNAFALSLRDLSKSLDIKITTLNSYEDNTFPRIDTLNKIVEWYAQAIPGLTIDDVFKEKLEDMYRDTNFNYFDEIKTSSGYQTIKSGHSKAVPDNSTEIEKMRLEAFNNIVKLASDENADVEVVKELLFSFNLNFKR